LVRIIQTQGSQGNSNSVVPVSRFTEIGGGMPSDFGTRLAKIPYQIFDPLWQLVGHRSLLNESAGGSW
jgi:hypothetical protein